METAVTKVLKALGYIAGGIALIYLMTFLSFLGALGPGGSPSKSLTRAQATDSRLQIVTSVQVWADVAQAIGGKYVRATAIIARPNQDPHSYEATVRDQLAVNRAGLTIENGGGYDPFFGRLVAARPNASPQLTLRLASAVHQPRPNLNPHFWYDLRETSAIVAEIAKRETWAMTDSAARAYIRERAAKYQASLSHLISRQSAVAKVTVGKGALLTEGFAARMLKSLAVVNETPREFVNAVEQEQDASPKVMRLMQQMLQGGQVQLVVTNQQTEGAQTSQLSLWAKAAGVPVLRLSELLPTGKTYLTWMTGNLDQIEGALR